MTMPLLATMVRESAGLLDPGDPIVGSEYRRALVELTCRVNGLVTDDWRDEVDALITEVLEASS